LGELNPAETKKRDKKKVKIECLKSRRLKYSSAFKDKVCAEYGSVDCSNPDLEPELCMMGSCDTFNY
jgi:hypothetical protein